MAWGYGPRRSTLDKLLVDGAVEAGAEFRDGVSVVDYVFSDGRVAGVRCRDRAGAEFEERAIVTVGADGRHSQLARAVDAPVYRQVPTVLCYYFGFWSDVEAEDFELYVRSQYRRVIFSFKTERGLYAVFVGHQSRSSLTSGAISR